MASCTVATGWSTPSVTGRSELGSCCVTPVTRGVAVAVSARSVAATPVATSVVRAATSDVPVVTVEDSTGLLVVVDGAAFAGAPVTVDDLSAPTADVGCWLPASSRCGSAARCGRTACRTALARA